MIRTGDVYCIRLLSGTKKYVKILTVLNPDKTFYIRVLGFPRPYRMNKEFLDKYSARKVEIYSIEGGTNAKG